MWHQILQSLKKAKQIRHIIMPGALWDKVIDFTDEPVVQRDVPTVKKTSLDDDDNDDCK